MEVSGHFDAGTLHERICLERLPFVHRAVSITMDSKGRNFGVLQADPKTRYEVFLKNLKTKTLRVKTDHIVLLPKNTTVFVGV